MRKRHVSSDTVIEHPVTSETHEGPPPDRYEQRNGRRSNRGNVRPRPRQRRPFRAA